MEGFVGLGFGVTVVDGSVMVLVGFFGSGWVLAGGLGGVGLEEAPNKESSSLFSSSLH
jgi:hypothetical protein